MREMQDGTISDVKETRTMLKELQEQTLELIELQKGNTFILYEPYTKGYQLNTD